jgi:diguanylate cyclase (GGDEF)-like protein/PAS domain S-box-containing protein
MKELLEMIQQSSPFTILESLGVAISILDTDLKVVYQNQLHQDIIGTHIGEYCYKAYAGRNDVCEECPVEMSFKDGKIHTVKRSSHTEQGVVHVEITSSPLKDAEGKLIAGIEVVNDITERQLTEHALRESEEKFRVLGEKSPNMIFINKEGRIVYANEKCEEIMGYSREELYAPAFDFVSLIAPESIDLVMTSFRRHLQGEEIPPYVYTLIAKDGQRIDAIHTTKIITYQGASAILGIITDITEHKRSEEALRESEEKYRMIFEKSPLGIMHYDVTGQLTDCNVGFTEIIGAPKEKVIDFNMMKQLKDKKMKAAVSSSLAGKLGHYEGEYLSVVGIKVTPIKAIFGPILSADGAVTGGIGIFEDITERKETEKALRESEGKYRSLVESTEDSIYLVDSNYKYLFMNRQHLRRAGMREDQYLGKSYGEFHTPEKTEEFMEKVDRVFETGESVRDGHSSHRDGKYFLRTFSPVKDADGRVTAVTIISKDITERKRIEEKLRSLSLADDLTGLYNRRGFFTLVEHLLRTVNRQKEGIFMLYADVDGLKAINDTFGHKEGDAALIEIAGILRENYRESDIIARIGGDEFVVIPVGTAKDSVEIITDRFHKALESHNAKRDRKYELSISIGISFYDPESPCSVDDLLQQADRSMYQQKRLKRKT